MNERTEFENQTENPDFPGVKDVCPDEVLAKKGQIKIVDVRHPDEFIGELGHIPGAELLTLDNIPQEITNLPKNETIVFICRSGRRSAQAANIAQENGFSSVFNMQGGMILWNELQLETEDKNQ